MREARGTGIPQMKGSSGIPEEKEDNWNPNMKRGTGIPQKKGGAGIPQMKKGHWKSRGKRGTGLDKQDCDDKLNRRDEPTCLGTVAGLPKAIGYIFVMISI